MFSKDNIDKNATVNLVQSHFHGTGVSLFQLLDHENQDERLDCHSFIDLVYTTSRNLLHFQLNIRNQGRFIVLQGYYLLYFVDSIMKICLSILN